MPALQAIGLATNWADVSKMRELVGGAAAGLRKALGGTSLNAVGQTRFYYFLIYYGEQEFLAKLRTKPANGR